MQKWCSWMDKTGSKPSMSSAARSSSTRIVKQKWCMATYIVNQVQHGKRLQVWRHKQSRPEVKDAWSSKHNQQTWARQCICASMMAIEWVFLICTRTYASIQHKGQVVMEQLQQFMVKQVRIVETFQLQLWLIETYQHDGTTKKNAQLQQCKVCGWISSARMMIQQLIGMLSVHIQVGVHVY